MEQTHDFAADATINPAINTATESRRTHVLARQVRWRARLDAALVLAFTAGGAWLGQGPGEALMGATAALGLGILFYVIRRDRDLNRLAAHARWRDRAVEGKGITLSEWKGGARMDPWPRRQSAPSGRPE
ncbi:hypothetical protein FJQ54_11280 [Sandaracinobacter neustonicus]|uniref:Uncharacterized protein n=1 Tax=Sandaracinobacter neustonicus TaxID=1715348 RepID=A0A501XIS4_9SPHN|nr:hypothetical protein [Sandaracinobacter neustonicus]TPE60568.1 hypothetical protein FJQ54_11280 [Sandaracinobacter neustonicus]